MDQMTVVDGRQGLTANALRVTGDGNLGAEVSGSVTPATSSVDPSHGTVNAASSELLAPDSTRYQIQFQNQDTVESIHLHLGPGDATTDDFRVGPGGVYSFPAGVSYTGKITAIATENGTKYALLVFAQPA